MAIDIYALHTLCSSPKITKTEIGLPNNLFSRSDGSAFLAGLSGPIIFKTIKVRAALCGGEGSLAFIFIFFPGDGKERGKERGRKKKKKKKKDSRSLEGLGFPR